MAQIGCSMAQKGCSMAQLVVRWPALWQARVQIPARHPLSETSNNNIIIILYFQSCTVTSILDVFSNSIHYTMGIVE
jgi:hypothetical protein